MKAIIVKKIETEAIDLHKYLPVFEEVGIPPLSVKVGECPEDISVERIRYFPTNVKHPDEANPITYYVKESDRRNFLSLVAIRDGFIREEVEKAVSECDKLWKQELATSNCTVEINTKNKIRNLSWYRRLFKDF